MKIAAAGNTEVPAYLVLLDRGYTVSKRVEPSGELWIATKEGNEYLAECPLMLLGLVTMGEAHGEDWMADDKETDNFLKQFDLA